MSKFCENCGSELKDTDNVCPNCGAAVTEATKDVKEEVKQTTTTNNAEKVPQNKKSFALIGGIAGGVVLLLIIILAICLGGKGYEKPIKNLCKSIEKANTSTFLKVFPDIMVKEEGLKDEIDKDDMKDLKESLEDTYGKNVKITYKVKDKEKIDKDDLKDLQEELEDEYGKKSKTKISDGYELTVDIKFKGKDDHKTLEDVKINVYKIGGKWCMLSAPSSMTSGL